ncbi:MAG: hypothetical protein LAT62_06000 [Natronospirillum sp.]|uniref:hypothetical protein n=1 Tax=Natronospirillum sp. TaxID=2812955 RepID=UPI0025E45A6B|nr:hypothetical protein [Natronospirillum sp.]MCH8551468.1 hypothetical protein [Natronospirillum sp.]
MVAGNEDMAALATRQASSQTGWAVMTNHATRLPAGFEFLPQGKVAAPEQGGIRPDLLPLCRHADGRYLCAQLSPMGRAVYYGEWSADAGWSPWTPHWEGVLVTLWALEALAHDDAEMPEDFAWIASVWPAVQAQSAGLPGWATFARLHGPAPLMILLERGVAPYPAILQLSAWADAKPESMPDNLEPLLVRERCRLWRSIDPTENSLQQVVKAVYAVQAMRRGEFDCRQPASPYALSLSAVLQEHWQHVPEPLRDDHLIKAARDGRSSILAMAWQEEAMLCRQRQHYADACRSMGQVWCADPSRMTAGLLSRWGQDADHADSACWRTLLEWHGFIEPAGRGSVTRQDLEALKLRL